MTNKLRVSLRVKLFLGFISVAIFATCAGLLGLNSVIQQQLEQQSTFGEFIPELENLFELRAQSLQMLESINSLIALQQKNQLNSTTAEEEKNEYLQSKSDLLKAIAAYDLAVEKTGENQVSSDILAYKIRDLVSACEGTFESLHLGLNDTSGDLRIIITGDAEREITRDIQELLRKRLHQGQEQFLLNQGKSQQTVSLIFWTLLASFLLSVLTALVLSTNLTKSLKNLQLHVKSIDFSQPRFELQEFTNDEFGDLGQAFSQTIDGLTNSRLNEQNTFRQRLEHAERLSILGEQIATLGHRINQPLTAINLFVQQARRETAANNLKHSLLEKLDNSIEQVQAAREIIREVLNFSRRPETISVEQISIASLVTRVLKAHEEQIRSNSIIIEKSCSEHLPKINSSRHKLEESLSILINNAIHACENTPVAMISISAETHQNSLQIRVQDNGQGIAEDDLPHLFERFFTKKSVGKGTGLGLVILKQLVTESGGEVTVESTEGVGSTFTISLPLDIKTEEDHYAPPC